MTNADDAFERALARAAERGPWRSLASLLDDEEVREAVRAEFPPDAEVPPAHITRRGFMRLLGASLALAGVGSGCRQDSRALPYVEPPDAVTPGVPSFYATALTASGPWATGVLVESREGRPVKIEGNPHHPASLGATGVFEQAALLELYDPSRARQLTREGRPSTWRAFVDEVVLPARGNGGRGLAFLLEPTTSPLVVAQLSRMERELPEARVYFHGPLEDGAFARASQLLYDRGLTMGVDFTRARRILSLDDDFLTQGPFALRYAREHAAARRPAPDGSSEGRPRLYVVEARLSPTGGMADGRLAVKRGQVARVAASVLREVRRLRGADGSVPDELTSALEKLRGPWDAWARAVAEDLVSHAGESAVVVGRGQPTEAHLLGALLNHALGNVAKSVWLRESAVRGTAPGDRGLEALAHAAAREEVRTLVILEGNPVYTAPADVDMRAALGRVPTTAYLSLYENETAAYARWFLPALHALESWGDARAYDGTVSLRQPLIRPLHGGHTVAEVCASFLEPSAREGRELLERHWRKKQPEPSSETDFETWWTDVLKRGLIPGSALPRLSEREGLSPRFSEASRVLLSWLRALEPEPDGALELGIYEDPRVHDGRFTNNAWLLELPEPTTKLTWDNAALLSPRTAARLGLRDEDVVRLRVDGREVKAPVLLAPGHADDTVSVTLGFGRDGSEVLARGVGFNAYALRTSKQLWMASGATVVPVGERHRLARTQEHWQLHGRNIVVETTVAKLAAGPVVPPDTVGPLATLYRLEPSEAERGEAQWGMAIDTDACTGCSACVLACQAENNIPVVGKEGVLLSREMHWLRVDRYFSGPEDAHRVVSQPMLCQHCERAPCEYVCPVNATVHSPDGLNEMVYNRCVGTRFCSNNCPYKVRRFNYFDYNRNKPETLRMVMNPEVTVRNRGVMEKCTFCVQRIRWGQRQARMEGRALREGEVKTACQQACPTEAIVFGRVSERMSAVSRLWRDRRAYSVLHELGTAPRVRYLAKVRDPNPRAEEG